MARVWVLDFPEAQSQYDIYRNIASQLESYLPTIQTAANVNILSLNDFMDNSSVLVGSYYDAYDTKTSVWYNRANGFRMEFNSFISALSNRIVLAQSLRDLWQSRIMLGHWEGSDNE